MSFALLLLGQNIDSDLIKSCDAVGFGPQGDFSCFGKSLVRCREQRLSIKLDDEFFSLGLQAQRMPFTAADLGVDAINLLSTAFDDAIKTNIVFECVGSNNVVVVAVENTDSYTPCLIDLAGDGFEFQREINVLGDDGIKNCERETIIRSVRARLFNCAAGRGSLITDHNPSANIALSGSRKLEARRRRAELHFCDSDGHRG